MIKNIGQIQLWDKEIPGSGTADGFKPYLDTFILESSSPTSVVIVFPGGGYAGRAAHEAEPIARWLNSAGISAAVCHYRVAPNRHPCPLNDAKQACRLVRSKAKEWNTNPSKIGVLGFSAGGHLVSTLATQWDDKENRPDAAVLCYPVISMTGEFSHSGSAKNLLGENPPGEMLELLSSEQQVQNDTPPCFLWHTSDDAAVNVKNSLFFAAALRENEVPFEMHIYPSGKHGLGLASEIDGVKNWTESCVRWLKSIGF